MGRWGDGEMGRKPSDIARGAYVAKRRVRRVAAYPGMRAVPAFTPNGVPKSNPCIGIESPNGGIGNVRWFFGTVYETLSG